MASIAHLVWAKMPVRQSWQQAGTEEEMRAARRRRYRQALCVAMTVILIGAVVLVALGILCSFMKDAAFCGPGGVAGGIVMLVFGAVMGCASCSYASRHNITGERIADGFSLHGTSVTSYAEPQLGAPSKDSSSGVGAGASVTGGADSSAGPVSGIDGEELEARVEPSGSLDVSSSPVMELATRSASPVPAAAAAACAAAAAASPAPGADSRSDARVELAPPRAANKQRKRHSREPVTLVLPGEPMLQGPDLLSDSPPPARPASGE